MAVGVIIRSIKVIVKDEVVPTSPVLRVPIIVAVNEIVFPVQVAGK